MVSYSKTRAFSLSELVITLSIIGIVASIMIPSLYDKNLEAQRISNVKAAYSILGRMINNVRILNGGSIRGCISGDSACFKDMLKTNSLYIKECNDNVITDGCWATNKYMDGTTANVSGSALVLRNGMLLLINWIDGDCKNPTNDNCGSIAVDYNGFKGPNKWGHDTFSFHVWDGVIKPYGISGDSGNNYTCNKSDSGIDSGKGCTAKYLIDVIDNFK